MFQQLLMQGEANGSKASLHHTFPLTTAVTGKALEFSLWEPGLLLAPNGPMSFVCAMTAEEADPCRAEPSYVLGAAFDGQRGCLVTREHARAFLMDHATALMANVAGSLVFHRAALQLAVLRGIAFPFFDIYRLVENNQVWDTHL